ncbi:MAG TPA: DMT family transporter [Acidimicrobiia bacterium]
MGPVALAGYVAALGVATYLLKVALQDLSAYQVNVLMGVAMLVVSVPAVLVTEGSLRMTGGRLPTAALVAVLMAVGSVLYALALSRLPAGITAAIATSYVVIVVVLSAIFLKERFDWIIALGVASTLGGVALLSYRA